MKRLCLGLMTVWLLGACAQGHVTSASKSGNAALQGHWRLMQLDGHSISMVDGNVKAFEFDAAQLKFSANVGCNRLFGLYAQEGSALRFNAVASTERACDPLSTQLERQVMQGMQRVQIWQISGDQLQLLDESKHPVLKLKRM